MKCRVIPPRHHAAFVACMEDVLDVYQQPYDTDCPVICMDEKPYQLPGESRKAIPMKRGRPKIEYPDCQKNRLVKDNLNTHTLFLWEMSLLLGKQ